MTTESQPSLATLTRLPAQVSDTLAFLLLPGLRIGRLRYLARLCLVGLCLIAATAVASVWLWGQWQAFALLMVPVLIGFVVVIWLFSIQRLHDIGWSGWVTLLLLLPGANLLLIVLLALWPGVAGVNRYGPRPPPNRFWHWLAGLLAPLLMAAMMGSSAYVVGSQLYTVYKEQLRLGAGESLPSELPAKPEAPDS